MRPDWRGRSRMASHDEAKELPVSRNDGSYSAKTTHSRDRPVFWDGRNYSAHAVRRGWAKILIFTALPEARARRANKCSLPALWEKHGVVVRVRRGKGRFPKIAGESIY